MTRTAMIGAALALLMSSAAFAQTTPSPTPGEAVPPPPAVTVEPVGPGGDPLTPPDLQATPDVQVAPEAGDAEEMSRGDDMRPRRERAERRRENRERRGDWADRRSREDRDERFGWRDHHGQHPMMGMMRRGRMGPQGAVFRLDRGDGGPSIVIRCADRDTTQECVDAIMPMLQTVLPGAR